MGTKAVTGPQTPRNRRRAVLTALILAAVALMFYAGIFALVSWRHP
jgi:predicted secreted protein